MWIDVRGGRWDWTNQVIFKLLLQKQKNGGTQPCQSKFSQNISYSVSVERCRLQYKRYFICKKISHSTRIQHVWMTGKIRRHWKRQKVPIFDHFGQKSELFWSECRDSNSRPLEPHSSAIPNFATPGCLLVAVALAVSSIIIAHLLTECKPFFEIFRKNFLSNFVDKSAAVW